MKATLVRIQAENTTKSIRTYWFKPEKILDQIAGQYVVVTLLHPKPDNRGEGRWFTLSNSPTEAPLISITTSFSASGSSFKRALRELNLGDQISVSDPIGDFVLPKDDSRPLVFVAIGMGITPFHSILKYLLDTRQQRQINLIYFVHSNNELIFQKLLDSSNLNKLTVIKISENVSSNKQDQLSGQQILNQAQPETNSLIYLAGPELTVESLEKQLVNLGIDKSRIITDLFEGY